MAVKFLDSCDHYSAGQIYQKWTGYTGGDPVSGDVGESQIVPYTVTVPPPPGCVKVLRQASNERGLYRTFGGTNDTITVGVWLYLTSLPSSSGNVYALGIMDGSDPQCCASFDASAKPTVKRGTTVLATAASAVTLNTWHHYELKAKIHSSAGTYELRVDGVTVIGPTSSANTQATGNAYGDGIGFRWYTIGYFKGWYALDSTGDVANTFVGPCIVQYLHPRDAGNYAQWGNNGGTNFGAVNDQTNDGDNSFNMSATADQMDTFQFEKLKAAAATIYGIQHVIVARQDGGAARQIAAMQRSSSTDYVGTTRSTTPGYQCYLQAQSINPDTSAGYSLAEINALEAGYKLIG